MTFECAHMFNSKDVCSKCGTRAPPIPAFMERQLLNRRDEQLANLVLELTAANARIAELEAEVERMKAGPIGRLGLRPTVEGKSAYEWIAAHNHEKKSREDAELRIAELEALLGEAPHSETCASRKTYMAGGISFDVNVRPDAREVRPPCNCLKSRA